MSIIDTKEIINQVLADSSELNAADTVIDTADILKTEADQEITDSIQAELSAAEAEYQEIASQLAQQYNEQKQEIIGRKDAQIAANKEAYERTKSFVANGKQIARLLDLDRKGNFVPRPSPSIEERLDSLEAQGFDVTDTNTVKALFSPQITGITGLNINSYSDLVRSVNVFHASCKATYIENASQNNWGAFKAIGEVQTHIDETMEVDVDITVKSEDGVNKDTLVDTWTVTKQNDDYYVQVTEALDNFKSKIEAICETYEVTLAEAYHRYFDSNEETTIKTKADFEAYEAELIETAKQLDISQIQDLYAGIRGTRYSEENYIGVVQGNTMKIKDQIAAVSERYGLTKDEVISTAFDKQCIQTEAELDKRLLADSYDINIRDILQNIQSLKVEEGTEINADFIASKKAVDLSTSRLKTAGVSEENIAKISELKTAFIDALEANESTRKIEMELGSAAIGVQSDMGRKQIKLTFAA